MAHIKSITAVFLFSIILSSCNSLKTAIFDQYAYQKSIEIKVETENLIDKADTPYIEHLEEIKNLELEIEKILEYENNRPNNEISSAMWQLLSNKDKNLLAGFLKRWREKEQLNPVFIKEAKGQISKALDLLIQYEAKKDKESKDNLLYILTNS